MQHTLFYLFSSLLLVCGTFVIRSRNPVYSVLYLILVFVNAAGLLLLLGLDFFAMIFLVVYVGAIAVLFLFVVMMLNIKVAEMTENTLRYLPVGGLIGFVFLMEVLLVVDQDLVPAVRPDSVNAYTPYVDWVNWSALVESTSNIQNIGMLMYTYYFYYFMLASFILLVAMIGAIMLTLHKEKMVKRQEVHEQNAREFSKTVQKVRIES
uniref:NADH-ubiquinone oxidoreductase chain 6 n=1 Tax=Chloroparvula japonica TaxID=1411623 RepID=A0A4D6C513_9CHLO|nr:NADH dehydrogenase subunit 6 [Chloroparvula japonica]QBX98775.1 NADH dehydrogenase subunit 6 [Chloroparvula japonica]